MPFGPKTHEKPRACPRCNAVVPALGPGPSPARCPACGADLRGKGEPGKALVDAMTDVLADPLGKRTSRD
jgi:hypothetical protein